MRLKTPEQVKREFFNRGETFSDWAKKNGYRREEVYDVISGRNKAKRGRGHEIAVKLGLKPAPEQITA
ncbi:MAG TPA: DNA-binding protein [Methylococcus sp.]|nr:DNA-binding protein [Methylococcus sp.]